MILSRHLSKFGNIGVIYVTLIVYSIFQRDGDRLQIELGRALQKGEFKCKILYLNLKEVS